MASIAMLVALIAAPAALATPPSVDFRLLSDKRDLERLADAFRLCGAALTAPGMAQTVLEVFPSTYSERVKKLLQLNLRNQVLTSLIAPIM